MAGENSIKVSTNFLFQGEKFLDERQGIAETLSDLLLWDVPIPPGFEVYVKSKRSWYTYDPEQALSETTGYWKKRESFEHSIPVYAPEDIEKLDPGSIPEKYILIPSAGELSMSPDPTSEGTYLDILFKSIRALQAEVAKLRNSFQYGIYSYNDTRTAMSDQLGSNLVINKTSSEPLWAIEESDLSLITTEDVMSGNGLEPLINVHIKNGYVEIGEETTWTRNIEVAQVEDYKMFLYLTTSNLNFKLGLEEVNYNIEDTPEVPTIDSYIDFSGFDVPACDYYNTMIIISRTKPNDAGTQEYGEKYIWISISDRDSNRKLIEGFFKNNSITRNKQLIEKKYCFGNLIMNNLDLYKFSVYSKYQDFTHEVIPTIPEESDLKYGVAHITIRSVKTKEMLDSIKNQLPNNELIFVEATEVLYIKNNGLLIAIGSNSGGGEDEDTMTEAQVIEILKSRGIIYSDQTGLQLNNISDVTFINQGTGKKFKYTSNEKGELVGTELPVEMLSDIIDDLSKTTHPIDMDTQKIRGFVAQINCSADEKDPGDTKNAALNSDRVKIGAVYCPIDTDTVFGCSHAYVELENTSTIDFPLDGCFLHFLHTDKTTNSSIVEHLALSGVLKGGSTYLIRGKKYSDQKTCPNTYIAVENPDIEWYKNGELIDFTITTTEAAGFMLTYGRGFSGDGGINPLGPQVWFDNSAAGDSKAPYKWVWWYIDSLLINKHTDESNKPWGLNAIAAKSNSIIRNTFELDPAKQAFQALNTYDSSRIRLDNIKNDMQTLYLDSEYISFPHSEEVYPVSLFSPKSSKEKKTVATDKSKLSIKHPNMVTCSFGINSLTTRCFNWISAGEFDEYVWIKDGQSTNWIGFESYKEIAEETTEDPTVFPRRREYKPEINNAVYKRMTGIFPADETNYTSHKCIVVVSGELGTSDSPKTYQYRVGRAKRVLSYEGSSVTSTLIPDEDFCSDVQTFTIYPSNYKPQIYQTTDQQGFHWIEYQAWAAAANCLKEKIESDVQDALDAGSPIVPVLVNTGDMTQNGTRINEWFDYYKGGEVLFKSMEQVNCVGNNDLCSTEYWDLKTGDDPDKSNAYYFHLFYCYEVPNVIPDPEVDKLATAQPVAPIIPSDKVGDQFTYKYFPSTYYIDFPGLRFVVVNSELTLVNCDTWFKRHYGSQTVNLYTGWAVPGDNTHESEGFDSEFTSIYTMIYNIFSTAGVKKIITMCHEMPFTVITKKDLMNSKKGAFRSVSGTSLVGSHLNQLTVYDKKSCHWFSRLLEHFGIHLCIGGHKHTYACTYPVQEQYLYEASDGTTVNSKTAGKMTMPSTLENDTVEWEIMDGDVKKNLSKFPLVHGILDGGAEEGYFNPVEEISSELTSPVLYFMCQATGFKLKSNKELPSNYQAFSQLIPKTGYDAATDSDKPDANQQYPMFGIIKISDNTAQVYLVRIDHILKDKTLTQKGYDEAKMVLQYAKSNLDAELDKDKSRYCSWVTSETSIVSIGL